MGNRVLGVLGSSTDNDRNTGIDQSRNSLVTLFLGKQWPVSH
jgi:hypothetical protein